MSESEESVRSRQALAGLINEHGVPPNYDGPLWTTEELRKDFEVLGFAAPFVVVKRLSDGQRGTLAFVHMPRVYFNFQPSDG